MYSVYVTVNDENVITDIFSTCFKQATPADILIMSGHGSDYVHVPYSVIDDNLCYNYKWVDGEMVERSNEEKLQDINNRLSIEDPIEIINAGVKKIDSSVENVSENINVVSDDNMLNMELIMTLDEKLNMIMEHLKLV